MLLAGRGFFRRWSLVVLVALAFLAIALGFLGFYRHFAETGEQHTVADLVYLTLQLFTLESGQPVGKISWDLQTARFLAPAVAAYALIRALALRFDAQWQRMRLRFWRDHVIVCGLGRKGGRLVEQLLEAGERVVVIDPSVGHEQSLRSRELGAIVLEGSSCDRLTLAAARVPAARALVAVTGDDGSNVETAVLAHSLNRGRDSRPLTCIVHVLDPALQTVFRQHALYADQTDSFELEFYNSFEIAARVMLRETPDQWTPGTPAESPHILVVGLGRLGETLLVRACKDWQFDQGDQRAPMRVTIIDRHAEERRRIFALRHPELMLGGRVEIEFVAEDISGGDFARGKFQAGRPPVTAAYVCVGDDSLGMLAALNLRKCLTRPATPIVVRMREEAGLAALLGAGEHGQPAIPHASAVGVLDVTCKLNLVLGGRREVLARAIHQGYLRRMLLEGQTPERNPSLCPWERLPADLQESNRQQADSIPGLLKSIGCELASCPEGPLTLAEFSPDEVERLATQEHERWRSERLSSGWRRGPQKDLPRKLSPYLVSWEELPEEIRNYSRGAVRWIPYVLARADLEIRRA